MWNANISLTYLESEHRIFLDMQSTSAPGMFHSFIHLSIRELFEVPDYQTTKLYGRCCSSFFDFSASTTVRFVRPRQGSQEFDHLVVDYTEGYVQGKKIMISKFASPLFHCLHEQNREKLPSEHPYVPSFFSFLDCEIFFKFRYKFCHPEIFT